jgi:hypothetical protein
MPPCFTPEKKKTPAPSKKEAGTSLEASENKKIFLLMETYQQFVIHSKATILTELPISFHSLSAVYIT